MISNAFAAAALAGLFVLTCSAEDVACGTADVCPETSSPKDIALLQNSQHLHQHAHKSKQHLHRRSRARANSTNSSETAALLEQGQAQSQGSQASSEGGLGEMDDEEWQGFVDEVKKSSEGDSVLRAQENQGQVAEDQTFDVDIHGGFKMQEEKDKQEKSKIDGNPLLQVQ